MELDLDYSKITWRDSWIIGAILFGIAGYIAIIGPPVVIWFIWIQTYM